MSFSQLLEALPNTTQTMDEKDGRIYRLLYGVVTDVDLGCAAKLPRIKHRIGGPGDRESRHWLDQACPGAVESVPNKKDPVVVLFIDGDPTRGVYCYFPDSNAQNRPTDYSPLGTTMAGIINNLGD